MLDTDDPGDSCNAGNRNERFNADERYKAALERDLDARTACNLGPRYMSA